MTRSAEHLVRGGHVGSELDGQVAQARRFVRILNAEIETGERQQSFRIIFDFRFNLTRNFPCRRTLAAQKEVCGKL
jgi:hypothetical protein